MAYAWIFTWIAKLRSRAETTLYGAQTSLYMYMLAIFGSMQINLKNFFLLTVAFKGEVVAKERSKSVCYFEFLQVLTILCCRNL